MDSQSPKKLIGRCDEIAAIGQVLEEARQGKGSVLLMAGEAGVGKTRLAEDCLARSGLQVFTGRAREDATAPYGPVASALRERLRRTPTESGDLGRLSAYLSVLLPEFGPCPEDGGPEILLEAVMEAWISMARGHPAALLLDDLHWADNATLELLPPLAERIGTEPLAVIATYRSDELAREHPIRRMRNDLRRIRRLREIAVRSMERKETAVLLERVLGSRPSPSLVDLVFEKTQGIPLYVEELAEALVSSGRVRDETDGIGLTPGGDVPVPESIRDAVLLRLGVLSEAARSQIEIASVAGVEFGLEMATSLAGGEAGIEELLEKNLIVETEPGIGGFRHALIRDAIRGQIGWSRRRTLHRRIAAYLDRSGAPPEAVAEHWLAANEHEPARRALLELADRSCRLHAYRDAARAGHQALEIWPAGEDEEERCAALLRLARCAQITGQLGDATRALEEVLGSAGTTADEGRRAEALRSLATVYELQGSTEQALDARTESARAFESVGSPAEAAVEWLAIAGRYTSRSALDRARDAARRAGTLAEGAGRIDLVVRAKGFEGNLLAMQGQSEAGRGLAQEALSLALRSNRTEAASEAYRRLASVFDYSSDFAGARDAYATAVEYCRTQGDDANARVCLGCMSFIVYRTGEWKRAFEVSREVLEDPRSPAGSTVIAQAVLGLMRACRGETRRARQHLEGALGIARGDDLAIGKMLVEFGLALVAELEDDVEEAARLHEKVLEAWRGTQDRHDLVPVFLWQSTFAGRHGLEREATRRADALATMASGTGNPESMAALAHALAEVSLLAGDATEAVRQFEQALARTEKLEIPLELAVTSWRLGSALARRGDRGGAVRHLNNAYRTARNLGARPISGLIAAELDALGERVEEGGHPDGAAREARAGLTRRQVEIVRLIAEGLTNKEIAAKLFLSPRTVDMHVGHLLDRLDCRSRVEAARRADELGLLKDPS